MKAKCCTDIVSPTQCLFQPGYGDYLGAMCNCAILAVTMLLKVKVGQAADVPDALHEHSVVAHKLQDGVCAVGQGEIQHKGGQQNTGHLLQEQAGLHTKAQLYHAMAEEDTGRVVAEYVNQQPDARLLIEMTNKCVYPQPSNFLAVFACFSGCCLGLFTTA